MKPTVSGGYTNLRGRLVRAKDIIGREFIGTVVTHVRDNKWSVQFEPYVRVTLKRSEFVLLPQKAQATSATQREQGQR